VNLQRWCLILIKNCSIDVEYLHRREGSPVPLWPFCLVEWVWPNVPFFVFWIIDVWNCHLYIKVTVLLSNYRCRHDQSNKGEMFLFAKFLLISVSTTIIRKFFNLLFSKPDSFLLFFLIMFVFWLIIYLFISIDWFFLTPVLVFVFVSCLF
jgi:hypothetical protein